MQINEDTQSLCVSTDCFSSVVEDIRSKETLTDQISGSEPPDGGSLQHSDSSQTKTSEPPEHSGDVFLLPTSRAGEGQRHTADKHIYSTASNNNSNNKGIYS